MNRKFNIVVATIVSAPLAFGVELAIPTASADPDLGHQVCSTISQQGLSFQTVMRLDQALLHQGHRDFDSILHQSIANDCPQYQGEMAQLDRAMEAANGNIMGCPPGMTYVPSLNRCRDF